LNFSGCHIHLLKGRLKKIRFGVVTDLQMRKTSTQASDCYDNVGRIALKKLLRCPQKESKIYSQSGKKVSLDQRPGRTGDKTPRVGDGGVLWCRSL